MKTGITSKSYKLALALLALSAGTIGFAQRGERGAERQGNPQRQGGIAGQRPEARQMPSMPDNRQRVSPGRPAMEHSPMQRQAERAPLQRISPTPERSMGQRPEVRQGQRPEMPGNRNNTPGAAQQREPNIQRPSVNNTQADARWNNRNSNNRPGYDNRVTADNRVRSNNNYNNRNYNNSYGNRNYNTNNYGNRNTYRYNGGYYYHPRPVYSRPPVIYGGRRFYTHYNYVYHPYRPYYYGSFFHPFGYFIGSLAASAVLFSWNNQYYGYDQGMYYEPYNSGYRVIPAPIGANISRLPGGYTTVNVEGYDYYYYAGTFYISGDNGFEIVPAPPGAVVYDLPEGAKEVRINDTIYIEYNGTYYQPVSINGRNGYEVVDTEEDDNF